MSRIYVSSTYEDLREHREAVYRALRMLGHEPISMDSYVAGDSHPIETSLADVAEADIYVGIVAHRYGYIPPPQPANLEQLSITHLEYRQAIEYGKPCYIFLLSDDVP